MESFFMLPSTRKVFIEFFEVIMIRVVVWGMLGGMLLTCSTSFFPFTGIGERSDKWKREEWDDEKKTHMCIWHLYFIVFYHIFSYSQVDFFFFPL